MKRKCFLILFPILIGIGCVSILKEFYIFLKRAAEKAYKHEIYYKLYDKWMKIKEEKKSLENFFVENDVKKIAVYGMGMLGLHLIKDLQGSNLVDISYGIDRVVENVNGINRIYKPDDSFPVVDMVVVTAIFSFDEVKEMLREKLNCPIVSIEEIIKDA